LNFTEKLAYLIESKKLTTKKRKHLKKSDFCIFKDGKGFYPIQDENHAKNALSRVSEYGTDEEKATVRAKVKKRYPNL
jgi:hypothetical protein